MSKDYYKLLERLADRLDQQEQEKMTATQLLQQGYQELEEQKRKEDEEKLNKYLDKELKDATPLEKGSAMQKVLAEKQAEQREILAEEMAKLKVKEKQRKNYLGQTI